MRLPPDISDSIERSRQDGRNLMHSYMQNLSQVHQTRDAHHQYQEKQR